MLGVWQQHYGPSGVQLQKSNLCVALPGLSMSTVEEESDTVTVETVNSVTLTQDTEGNLILHCPQNGTELYCIVFFFLVLINLTTIHPCPQIL